jgi:hypothetical protein
VSGVDAESCEPLLVRPAHVLSVGLDLCSGLTGPRIGRDACNRLGRRCMSVTFKGGESAARKVVSPLPDDIDYLLKLTRCQIGHDLMNRSGFGN